MEQTKGLECEEKEEVWYLTFEVLLLRSVFRLIATANVVPSSPILVTLMTGFYKSHTT
jgi:hypothetical protein